MRSTKFGSLEAYFVESARACLERGYRTLLQYEEIPQSQEYLEALRHLGVDVQVVPTHNQKFAIANVMRLLLRTRPNVIHTHFSQVSTISVATTVGRVAGAKKVLSTVHNRINHRQYSRASYAYNRCDHVLGVSHAVVENLIDIGVRRELLSTHYLGLVDLPVRSRELRDTLRAQFDISTQATVIANIGFDAPFKGVDVLINTMEEITAHYPDVVLLQIGIDKSSPLVKAVAAHPVSKAIRWAGIVDHGWQYLNAADFYVQPSRHGEGLPLSIMEAMAVGLPVVATKVSGNNEAVANGQTGLLCTPDDAEALLNAVIQMIESRDRWSLLGNEGLRRAQKLFDGQRSVEELVHGFYDI
jgi:glycosyltransferase involved in cell wall biosynthesis